MYSQVVAELFVEGKDENVTLCSDELIKLAAHLGPGVQVGGDDIEVE